MPRKKKEVPSPSLGDFEELPDPIDTLSSLAEGEQIEAVKEKEQRKVFAISGDMLEGQTAEDGESVPDETSEGWNEYVMGQFAPDELIEGNPTVDGLRRVAQKLIGPIMASETTVVSPPNKDSNFKAASVVVRINLLDMRLLSHLEPGRDLSESGAFLRIFSGAADCSRDNTDPPYHLHPTATAETKAEGRALKRALCLKKVHAAEELSKRAEEVTARGEDEWSPDQKITPELIEVFKLLGHAAGVNVAKFVNGGKEKFKRIEDIPFATARIMHRELDAYAGGRKPVPERFKGYIEDFEKGDLA